MNTGWWEIDIRGCYWLVKIAFAPICTCKNNRRIWRHNARTPRSCDVTNQAWWRHNGKSEKTALCDNGVTRENYWLITSLVTPKSLFTVTHASSYTSVYLHTCGDANWEAIRGWITTIGIISTNAKRALPPFVRSADHNGARYFLWTSGRLLSTFKVSVVDSYRETYSIWTIFRVVFSVRFVQTTY